MPNVLAGREIFPEFIQDRATAKNLATAAGHFLTDTNEVSTVRNSLDEVAATLGEPGAAARAAQAVIAQMDKPVWH